MWFGSVFGGGGFIEVGGLLGGLPAPQNVSLRNLTSDDLKNPKEGLLGLGRDRVSPITCLLHSAPLSPEKSKYTCLKYLRECYGLNRVP